MIFTSWLFAVFLLLTVTVYWACPPGWRKYLLVAAGFLFYLCSMPAYLLLVAALTAAVHLAARAIAGPGVKGRRVKPESLLIGGIVLCVAVLVAFKYLKLIAGTVNQLEGILKWGVELPAVHIVAPLGISYFIFQFIHYLVDVYKGRIARENINFINLLAFTVFFPTLASGPIKRYPQFQEQIDGEIRFNAATALEGMRRIIFGLGKKFIIADTFSQLTGALASPEQAGRLMLAVAVYAYAIKIYYDFSGYTDMAVGCSLLFGIRVPENFNSPYLKRNISEFWRSWHMSLSSWIRDYLFIPLGGSRVSLGRNLFNLITVMAICGLWHGASWNYLVWGLWHGTGMAIHRVSKIYPGKGIKIPGPLAVALTFHFVAVGWIFFSTPDLSKALLIIKKIFLPGG